MMDSAMMDSAHHMMDSAHYMIDSAYNMNVSVRCLDDPDSARILNVAGPLEFVSGQQWQTAQRLNSHLGCLSR